MANVPSADRLGPRTKTLQACPLCLGTNLPVFLRAPDRLHGTPGEFTYSRCRTCGTVFQNPQVIAEDLGTCYPLEYGTHQAEPNGGDAGTAVLQPPPGRLRRTVEAALADQPLSGWLGVLGRVLAHNKAVRERVMAYPIFTELLPPEGTADNLRALDVGCGAGRLLNALSRLGWQAEGVEWDPAAAAVARAATGLNVRDGDFRQIDLPLAQYDLVVLSHCFEHLDDPIGSLRRLRELLKSTGKLVLIYPNPKSLGVILYGTSWFDWDPPRHLVIPPLSSLGKAAEKLGFKVNVERTLSREAFPHLVHSRAIKEKKPPAQVRVPRPVPSDYLWNRVERILTTLGFDVGEEAVLVLEIAPE